MRRLCATFAPAAVLACLLLAAGCNREQPAAGGAPPAPPPKPQKAKVTAWVNVTSGCQQPTVDLLNQLAKQYADTVDVETVDFGQPDGAQRWQEAGLSCMAIQFDGKAAVVFPRGGADKVVVFQMPAGFNWVHEDLTAAFSALAAGSLRAATEEEVKDLMAPRLVELDVRAQEVRDVVTGGKAYGQLLVGDVVFARAYATVAGKSPAQRCKAAQLGLEAWLSKPILPSDLSVAQSSDGWGLYVGDQQVLLAAPEDATGQAKDLTPQVLASQWLKTLRRQVVLGVAKAREAAAAKPEETEESAEDCSTSGG